MKTKEIMEVKNSRDISCLENSGYEKPYIFQCSSECK